MASNKLYMEWDDSVKSCSSTSNRLWCTMEAKKILKKIMPLYALKKDSLPFVRSFLQTPKSSYLIFFSIFSWNIFIKSAKSWEFIERRKPFFQFSSGWFWFLVEIINKLARFLIYPLSIIFWRKDFLRSSAEWSFKS